jgi:galactokinase
MSGKLAMKTFEAVFNAQPTVAAEAPGRVNLLGEHTDYSDGYVLPTTIPQRTHIAARANGGVEHVVYSADLDRIARYTLERPPEAHFATYLYGCVREAVDAGVSVPPLDVYIHSSVPMGVGLSSSAALEVAMLRALRELCSAPWDDVTIARLAQAAEIKYAGVHCGIMDQMASSLASSGSMLFLDTRTLERRLLPMPANSEILVIDSGIPRTLAATAYNDRRAECEAAAKALGVRALRDVTDPHAADRLPAPLSLRARHVITENARVLEAARGADAARFGQLMNDSHGSLRDDYEVSVVALDQLVELLQRDSAVYGARLTGAGFGGACVALCHAGMAAAVGSRVVAAYNSAGAVARVLVAGASGDAASPSN